MIRKLAMLRSMGRYAGLALAGLLSAWLPAAFAPAQEVIYSQAGPGGYSRYEQYGYGPNAVVRYQGTETTQYGQGVTVQSNANVQRYGTAPQFGTFAGTRVNSQGITPGGLYQSLGPGVQTQGQIQYSASGQPYYQQTPYGPVLVQPQPYFVRQQPAAAAAQPGTINTVPGPIARAPIQVQQMPARAPMQVQQAPVPVQPQGRARIQATQPAPARVVPAPPAAMPPP